MACADGDFSECSGESKKCAARAGTYLGKKYPTCPTKELLEDRHLLYVLQLEREASIAPLHGWPDAYADWVVSLLGMLKAARNKREHTEMESIRKKTAKR